MTKEYQNKLKKFAAELLAARTALGLSQSEVASRANNMSLRNLINYENNKFPYKPRARTIVLLSSALEKNPRAWLSLLGYEDITDETLQQMGKTVGIKIPASIEPLQYFNSLKSRISGRKALLCLTFLSRVGLTQARAIQLLLGTLVSENDLFVAIIIPHPQNIDIKATSKTSLVNYYHAIYNDAIEFAKDILLKVDLGKRDRIGLYYPSTSTGDFFIPPHISHSYIRSTLLKISDKSGSSEEDILELGAWGTTRHNNKDNWFRMFPDPEGVAPNDAEDLVRYWISYLQEIIEADNFSGSMETSAYWNKETIKIKESGAKLLSR